MIISLLADILATVESMDLKLGELLDGREPDDANRPQPPCWTSKEER